MSAPITTHVAEIPELELRLLLEAIYAKYHYDFREYAMNSIRRRLAQAQFRLGCNGFAQLHDLVLARPSAFAVLLQYLTVQVSDMFRDPGYFRALREQVVPVLQTYPSLRVWVAGCSTGEEAYSLAILFEEHGLLDRTLIYATDINAESLRIAQNGVYALDRIANWSRNHRDSGAAVALSEYYTAGYGAASFDRRLREHIVFSDHSLATDSVFAEVQLVSCRNVLIYFNRDLQARACRLFCKALCRKGFLGLGAKETAKCSGPCPDFAEFMYEQRIYRRS